MISESQASALAQQYAATSMGQRMLNRGAEISKLVLLAFPGGWVVGVADDAHSSDPDLGEALHVVDAERGQLLQFPPAVPPPMILNDYPQMRERAEVLLQLNDLEEGLQQGGTS